VPTSWPICADVERVRAGSLLGPFDEHAALFALQQHYGFIVASATGECAKQGPSSGATKRAGHSAGDVGGGPGDVMIRVLGVGCDDPDTVAACRNLVVSSHEALAHDFPAVKRFWKNVSSSYQHTFKP